MALADRLGALAQRNDRAFVKALSFGALRWFDRLSHTLDRYLDKPLRRKDADVRMLILVGLYQLGHLDTPDHAAISATVDAADILGKPWAKALVNAVLRRAQREAERGAPDTEQDFCVRYSHPRWLIDGIRTAWPEQWRDVLQANNERPPQYLRVNLRKNSREDYLDELQRARIGATAADLTPCAIRILEPVEVGELPGFADGRISIQDLGAQLAAPLLQAQAGERVLDACAAPGGKTAHICELQPRLAEITATDVSEKRVVTLRDTLRRLDLQATVIQADVADPTDWWQGQPFDRVLLDAPCSATGVIRRHPDVKRLKDPERVAAARPLQLRLLASAWSLLRSGGTLLYSTCSVLHDENDGAIAAFLQDHPTAKPETIKAAWGVPTRFGRQLLPGQHDTDGFYYALLSKTGNS